jgi:hypothetical protein
MILQDPRFVKSIQLRHELSGPLAKAMEAMFPEQSAAVRSSAKRRAFDCSRRAGKSNGGAIWLYEGGLSDPGGLSLYVGRTQFLARKTMVPAFIDLKINYGLDFTERTEENQLQILLPNKHMIWLAGCKNSVEFGKFRGPKYRRVFWDEASLAGEWLEEAIEDAIDPAVSDKDGEIVLGGTPGFAPVGYWYECAMGIRPGWERHHWTCLDNVYWRWQLGDTSESASRKRMEYLAEKRRVNRWSENHPTYVREWLGLWVRDDTSMVFNWQWNRNRGDPPDEGERRTVIAIDVGSTSPTAWTVAQVVDGDPNVYFVECFQQAGLTVSAVAAYTARFRERYPRARVVVDEGGLGAGYSREMRERHGIPCEAADKRERRVLIESMRGDILAGTVKTSSRCIELEDEWEVLRWNEDRSNFDDRFADHLTDSALYAFRHLRARYKPELVDDTSFADRLQAAHKERIQKYIRNVNRKRRFQWDGM